MNLKKLLHLVGAGGIVLAMSVFGSGAAAREAQAIPGTFRSSIVVANPGTVEANVTLNFVKSDGNMALSPGLTFRVAPGGSSLQYVPNIAGLADGRYSVVIDSDQNVSAIANLASDNPATSTSYNGIGQSDVGRTFNIPSVYRNYFGYTSNIVVQNAGTATANVTITYNRAGSAPVTETRTIPNNASVTFDQGATTGLADGFVGSAVVTADQDVAAIFLISQSSPGVALSSGRGARAGAPALSLPSIYNNYFGYQTNVLVQNVDTTATAVTITYYEGGQAVAAQNATIQPGASTTFFQFDTGQGASPVRAGFNGSAVVRSNDNKNIIAVANVLHGGQNDLESYSGFATTSATQRFSCPSIFKNYFNFNTSLTVQNVGTSATNLSVQYIAGGQTVATATVQNLQPNSGFLLYSPNAALPEGFNGAAIVTSSGAPIIGLVNQTEGTGAGAGDELLTYACANS